MHGSESSDENHAQIYPIFCTKSSIVAGNFFLEVKIYANLTQPMRHQVVYDEGILFNPVFNSNCRNFVTFHVTHPVILSNAIRHLKKHRQTFQFIIKIRFIQTKLFVGPRGLRRFSRRSGRGSRPCCSRRGPGRL